MVETSRTGPAAGPRHVPDGEELALLMRCCGYRLNRAGAPQRGDPPSADDLAEARRRGWDPGRQEVLSAQEFIDRAIAAVRLLGRDDVAAAFVAGVGGSAPHGRQTLISFAWAVHLPAAVEEARPGLPDCGLPDPVRIDFTHELVRLALGWAWNELPGRYLPDLEAAARHGLPRPTEEDYACFRQVIEAIASQPPGTTPGALEKDIARRKLIPRSDKYQRYGILEALAEAGVIPNPDIAPSLDRHVPRAEAQRISRSMRSPPRSDIVLPLAGWRGGMGVDRQRLRDLFGIDAG